MRDDEGGEFVQYRLAIEPRAARRARHVISSVLDGWRLGGLADDVVSCAAFPHDLIGTEADDWPIMQLAGAGRGIALVDALCDRLTWHPYSGGGKVVRCRWWLRTTTDTTHVEPRSFDLLEG